MKSLLKFLAATYSLLLHLYPRGFKEEFAAEMHIVFRESIVYAAREGICSVLAVCIRELILLPISILQEFWFEIQRKQATMQIAQDVPMQQPSGSWAEAVWAGLPHLLIGVSAGFAGFLAGTRVATLLGITVLGLLLAGLSATVYYTWRDHWPAWSASWYGYIGLIILLFSLLPSQGWAPPAEGLFVAVRFLLLPLCLAVLIYWLTRRNPIEALLMAMPVIIIYWFPVTEFIPNQIRNWLIVGIFSLSALAAISITRMNTIRSAIWIVLGVSILAGVPISYARTYWQEIPFPYTPTIGQMAALFSVQWLASSALALGPVLGWGIWSLGKRYGRDGRLAASLILIGSLASLWGQFRYWQWSSHQNFFDAFGFSLLQTPDRTLAAFTTYAGLVGTWAGAILLAIRSWTDSKPLSFSLVIVPLVLPLFAMFPIYFGWRIIPPGLSFEFGELSQTYKLLIFSTGGLLVAASGWLVTRLYSNPIRTETA